MVDPSIISLGLLGLSVLQTIALAWIAARYGTATQTIAAGKSDRSAERTADATSEALAAQRQAKSDRP